LPMTAMFVNGIAATGNSCFWLADLKKSSPLKPLGQMNRNLVGSIYGRSSLKMLISSRSVIKHGHHRQFLFLIGWFLKNLLLCNRLGEDIFKSANQKQELPMEAMFVNGSEINEQSL
jgi:hypothetical protein